MLALISPFTCSPNAVDSGAIYSVVPAATLKKLGLRPVSEETFTLANGQNIKRKKGIALFKWQDKIGGADVIFGEPGDSKWLGAFTLEALGLALDPLKRELRPLPPHPGLLRNIVTSLLFAGSRPRRLLRGRANSVTVPLPQESLAP